MPRRFFNLHARILLWLLINVLVLGAGSRWQEAMKDSGADS